MMDLIHQNYQLHLFRNESEILNFLCIFKYLTVCPNVFGYLFRIGHVDKRRFDVHLGMNDFPEESVGSSVEVVHGDHVISGVQQVNNGTARGET
jgi:hypothetical protein